MLHVTIPNYRATELCLGMEGIGLFEPVRPPELTPYGCICCNRPALDYKSNTLLLLYQLTMMLAFARMKAYE